MYGLIGMPLGHSHSPEVHAAFGYQYELIPLPETALDDFFAKKAFDGINVTIPYKKTVFKYLDVVDESASECGAVNTIVNENGVLTGYNTDIDGMAYTLRQAGITLRNKNVVILGTGGTSHTAQALCKREKAKSVTVVGRKSEINYDNVYDLTETEVIMNATPVGMFPKNGVSPVDVTRFPRLVGVFDAIYNPIKTRLVLEAEKADIRATGGINMLVAQAKRGAEIFTGKQIDDRKIAEISGNLVKKISNIAIVGMPGCGKTTVGKALASALGRDFYDADAMAEEAAGKPVPTIITEDGEPIFRELEKKIIAELTAKQGVVIATGGGAVLNPDNRMNLRQNGVCVRLTRDIDSLPTENRPLSKDRETVARLAKEREPYYAACADFTVENSDIGSAVSEILKRLGW